MVHRLLRSNASQRWYARLEEVSAAEEGLVNGIWNSYAFSGVLYGVAINKPPLTPEFPTYGSQQTLSNGQSILSTAVVLAPWTLSSIVMR
jgi:hypothetical protein